MQITLHWLEKHQACAEGVDFFKTHFGAEGTPSAETVLEKIAEHKAPWQGWLYETARLSGLSRSWYSNGQLEDECTYTAGQRTGLFRRWYFNGQLLDECTYAAGQRTGLYRRWYSDDQLWEECTFAAGQRTGLYRRWHGNGQLLVECTY